MFLMFGANLQICFATHVKAADIKVQRDPNDAKKYTFTLYVYFDESKVTGNGAIDTDFTTLHFGDNSEQRVGRAKALEIVSPGIVKGTYIFTHQYRLLGNYFVGYTEENRVASVLNMYNSGFTPLYIESMISIQPFLGVNDSPILTIPPIDNANKGQIFTYNTGAYDPNGDSLSFEIIPTKQAVDKEVTQYTSPADPKFGGVSSTGGASTITIDPKTGDLTWDSPGQIGIYNIAIKVSEFRDGTLVGYVIRDMQINVKDTKNKPPKLKLQNDTCYVANGKKLLFDIITTDTDNNKVSTNAFGALIESGAAVFNTNSQRNVPSLTQIVWQPTCGAAQDQPYQFNLMAQDYPTNGSEPLFDFKTLSIKLNAPMPTNFKVTTVGKTAKLTWDAYNKTCPVAKFQDTIKAQVEIYRQECDSLFTNTDCNKGISGKLSGELIGTVKITDSVFVDDNNGKGLKTGSYYFYTIKPRSNDKSVGGGAAISPDAQGVIIQKNIPLLKNISVIETGLNGKLRIAWTKPIDSTGLLPPFTYKLLKSTGLKSNQFVQIYEKTSNHLLDTFYVDNANTQDSLYLYKLEFYNNNSKIGETESASNLLVKSKAANGAVSLTVLGKSIYSIDHFNIYNATSGSFIKRVSPQSDSLTTIDITGLTNCDTACFKVQSVGKYCINIGYDSLDNLSQQICDVPRIGSKPIVQIAVQNTLCANYTCENSFPSAPYKNFLNWMKPKTSICDQPKGYNIYYALNDKTEFNKIGETLDTTFVHSNLPIFSGCYLVKTVNFNDEEGEASNVVCQDICPCFELPNIVTPDGDSHNDLFIPLFPPRFVETVKFSVYNRWGAKVYESSDINEINIKWDSKSLSDGVYFYEAEVTFSNRASEADRKKTFKNWVQVAR